MGRINFIVGIIALIPFLFACKTSSNSQTRSDIATSNPIDSLDCYSLMRSVGEDTSQIDHCVRRNASIYVEGKSYTYKATILDSNQHLLSKSTVKIIGENGRHPDSPKNQMNIEVIFERFPSDSLKLNGISGNKNCCTWLTSWNTGITENIERIWIHPIRMNQFTLTETAGFPEVHFPLEIGNSWNRSVTMGDWGDWKNKSVATKYTVKSKKKYKLKGKKIDCWEVQAISQFDSQVNSVTYLFNEKFGFVLMKYEFHNGIKINFEMTNYIFNLKVYSLILK